MRHGQTRCRACDDQDKVGVFLLVKYHRHQHRRNMTYVCSRCGVEHHREEGVF